MKKNILIVYSKMEIGGSTTSLLSLLNCMDYTLYNIDLLLYSNNGELQSQINENVNILPSLEDKVSLYRKILRPDFWYTLIKARMLSKKYNAPLINAQFMSKYEVEACMIIDKLYDIGISFLEFLPMEYLVRNVNAKKKISWIHTDITKLRLLGGVNEELYTKLDYIVVVSKTCMESMRKAYPEHGPKFVCVENILSAKTIRDMSKRELDVPIIKDGIKFVSVCRIDFASKGLDRAVKAFAKLKSEGMILNDVCWYVIGDGPDKKILQNMIVENNLDNHIKVLGKYTNPYYLEKEMDIFLLPSRYEGKPMAVTEAQMLGVIPLVCNYSSAKEQIADGIDGIIADNNDTDIYYKLRAIILGEYNLKMMKQRIVKKDYSNLCEIDKIFDLFENKSEGHCRKQVRKGL